MSQPEKPGFGCFLRTLLIIGGGGIALCILLIFTVFLSVRGTTWVWTYRFILPRMQTEETQFFPEKIPASASMAKFSTAAGFLQGGRHLQLRLRLPEEEIRQLEAHYRSKRTQSYFGGSWGSHLDQPEGMPITSFFISGTDELVFPEHYEN